MERTTTQAGRDADILLVEDNQGDVRLLEEAFHDASISNTLHVVTDGGEALDFVYQREEYTAAPVPDLVLLDWNLPDMSGEEVLKELKSDPALSHIPVIVLTGSDGERDIVTSYNEQANAYVTKPVEADEFFEVVRSLEQFWLSVVHLPPHTDEE